MNESKPLPGKGGQNADTQETSEVDLASIDDLLAAPDQGWDVDDQVRTLRQAAVTSQGASEASGMSPRGALQPAAPAPKSSTNALAPPAVPPAPATSAPALKPSKGPPPLPRKGPPPLPAAPSARPPPASAANAPPQDAAPPRGALRDLVNPEALLDQLQARVTTLEARRDKVGVGRALVELAVAAETLLGDERRAVMHAQAALRVAPTSTAAHEIVRRVTHGRAALGPMLDHLEQELAAATRDEQRVELLSERARLLEAAGGRSDDVRAAWEQALEYAPGHPAAMKGLEAELATRTVSGGSPRDWDALATHFGRMADACVHDPELASWLHVERARVLERKLDRIDAARGALERALELDAGVGPVRDALVRHVATHGDWTALAHLLDEEARIEDDAARATRLELEAALLSAWRLGDKTSSLALLERAAARAPTAASVDRRVLDELIRLNESEARWVDAARSRRRRLRFISDPIALAYELRMLASVAEREGDAETATADVQRALNLDPGDPSIVDWLDRLLSATGRHEPRIATWLQEAARSEDPLRRSRALIRAAGICEAIGRREDAVRHLRSAWVVAPGDHEALDGLARLLAPQQPGPDAGARSLVELYGQAADASVDPERRLAYFDRVGLLWEEVLGDPTRAARTYEHILSLEPHRRSALVGLQRVSARLGDERTLARALLEEARATSSPEAQLELKTRAASALAELDPARAIQLVREVLEQDPSLRAARELETSLCESAGRWELAVKSLRARVEIATAPSQKVALWLALAQIQHGRLRAPQDALASLERARAIDPAHPVPAEEAARVLDSYGDARALREALDRLASGAQTPAERARQLARAAEIDELRLNDDASAAKTTQRALAETPEDELLSERLARLAARRARKKGAAELAELSSLLAKRIERAPTPAAGRAASFELVSALVEASQEPMRAASLLEALLAEDKAHIPALRTLEWVRRRTNVDVASLGRVLSRQAQCFKDPRARLGALWNLAALEEWVLPNADPQATYRAILELDPADLGALQASLRRELVAARRGDPRAKKAVVGILRALVPFADDEARLAVQLRLALLLESTARETADPQVAAEPLREALEWYRDALKRDPGSVTAATGVARLSNRGGDSDAMLAGALALADLTEDGRARARCLLDAAELLLGIDEDPRLGTRTERRQRAVAILERALDADPDSVPVAGRLSTVLLEEKQAERLVTLFRAALVRARSPDAVVMFGSEIARVARGELNDLPVAIDAMRRVRAAAPQHIPSLLTLAELCIAQRVWADAVEVLEAVVAGSRDVPPKLTALFALASVYEKVLDRPVEVDRVLRAAIAIDPANVRALRALVRRILAEPPNLDEPTTRVRRRESAELLERLAEAEPDLDARSTIWMELSEVHQRLADSRAAERALVTAVATSPSNARALTRLAGLFRAGGEVDAAGYARALGAVIALGEQFGRGDARWYAALGQVEIDALGRRDEGIAHLQHAASMDPTLCEARVSLARALESAGRHGEAVRVLLGMIASAPQPLLSTLEPSAALALLEKALTGDRRPEEAVVVAELRALDGDIEEARAAWLRSRRLAPIETAPGALDRQALVTQVLPASARNVLLDLATAIAGSESKVLRSDLSELGIGPRDRISPRSGHPTRAMVDRLARQLGIAEVELAIAPNATHTRVLTQDTPWIVVPASLVELPESTQLVALSRALVRIALGLPWLEELPLPQIEALLVAAARQVVPGFGPESKAASTLESAVGRALTRRQRKWLDELAPQLGAAASEPLPVEALVNGVLHGELRAAFLLTGDLLSVVDAVALTDPSLDRAVRVPGPRSLAAVLEHAWLGDVVRFALTAEATTLRRRVGSTWSR